MRIKKGAPELVTVHIPSKTYDGYTLFAPWGGKQAWLVDMQGRFVHRWEMPYIPGENCVLLPNGNLLYSGKDMDGPIMIGGAGGVLLEVDWQGDVVWAYKDPYLHHDFCRMDNGNTMVLRWVRVPDDLAARVQGGVGGTEREDGMWTDSFREITPAGEVAWEWLGYEHWDLEVDVICPLCSRAEWTHGNSCFVLPNGDILTTFRHTDYAIIIDKSTGDIKWRWGAKELAHPHDPTLLGNGNILIFDNGNHRALHPLNYSRVLEVNVNTGEIEWQYAEETLDDFYSSIVSGCQRLPNGNTLICEGHPGRIFEVTAEGELVWEFSNPFYYPHEMFGPSNQIFRAYRYGLDYDGLGKGLDHEKFEWTPGPASVRVDDSSDRVIEWCGWGERS